MASYYHDVRHLPLDPSVYFSGWLADSVTRSYFFHFTEIQWPLVAKYTILLGLDYLEARGINLTSIDSVHALSRLINLQGSNNTRNNTDLSTFFFYQFDRNIHTKIRRHSHPQPVAFELSSNVAAVRHKRKATERRGATPRYFTRTCLRKPPTYKKLDHSKDYRKRKHSDVFQQIDPGVSRSVIYSAIRRFLLNFPEHNWPQILKLCLFSGLQYLDFLGYQLHLLEADDLKKLVRERRTKSGCGLAPSFRILSKEDRVTSDVEKHDDEQLRAKCQNHRPKENNGSEHRHPLFLTGQQNAFPVQWFNESSWIPTWKRIQQHQEEQEQTREAEPASNRQQQQQHKLLPIYPVWYGDDEPVEAKRKKMKRTNRERVAAAIDEAKRRGENRRERKEQQQQQQRERKKEAERDTGTTTMAAVMLRGKKKEDKKENKKEAKKEDEKENKKINIRPKRVMETTAPSISSNGVISGSSFKSQSSSLSDHNNNVHSEAFKHAVPVFEFQKSELKKIDERLSMKTRQEQDAENRRTESGKSSQEETTKRDNQKRTVVGTGVGTDVKTKTPVRKTTSVMTRKTDDDNVMEKMMVRKKADDQLERKQLTQMQMTSTPCPKPCPKRPIKDGTKPQSRETIQQRGDSKKRDRDGIDTKLCVKSSPTATVEGKIPGRLTITTSKQQQCPKTQSPKIQSPKVQRHHRSQSPPQQRLLLLNGLSSSPLPLASTAPILIMRDSVTISPSHVVVDLATPRFGEQTPQQQKQHSNSNKQQQLSTLQNAKHHSAIRKDGEASLSGDYSAQKKTTTITASSSKDGTKEQKKKLDSKSHAKIIDRQQPTTTTSRYESLPKIKAASAAVTAKPIQSPASSSLPSSSLSPETSSADVVNDNNNHNRNHLFHPFRHDGRFRNCQFTWGVSFYNHCYSDDTDDSTSHQQLPAPVKIPLMESRKREKAIRTTNDSDVADAAEVLETSNEIDVDEYTDVEAYWKKRRREIERIGETDERKSFNDYNHHHRGLLSSSSDSSSNGEISSHLEQQQPATPQANGDLESLSLLEDLEKPAIICEAERVWIDSLRRGEPRRKVVVERESCSLGREDERRRRREVGAGYVYRRGMVDQRERGTGRVIEREREESLGSEGEEVFDAIQWTRERLGHGRKRLGHGASDAAPLTMTLGRRYLSTEKEEIDIPRRRRQQQQKPAETPGRIGSGARMLFTDWDTFDRQQRAAEEGPVGVSVNLSKALPIDFAGRMKETEVGTFCRYKKPVQIRAQRLRLDGSSSSSSNMWL